MSAWQGSWGRDSGRSKNRWRLTQNGGTFTLTAGTSVTEFAGEGLTQLSTRRRWFRHSFEISGGQPERFRGLRSDEAAALDAALALQLARHRATPVIAAAVRWNHQVWSLADAATASGRWIPRESLEELERNRPLSEAVLSLRRASDEWPPTFLTGDERHAVVFLEVDLGGWIAAKNEAILNSEQEAHRRFFERVENKPLTDEQVRAVVCFDNRVHVVASAGSGKTSVMVARAAYAVMRGFVAPERILLLAFNRDAAAELQARVKSRLKAVGVPAEGVKASTFHKFGLDVMARATGKKPRTAPWLDGGQDVEMVCRIVDELRDRSEDFAYRWDLFRLLYANVSDTPDGGEADGYDRTTKRTGFRTVNGEVVKSEGERIIADWLFFNGVTYEYERAYDVDTADVDHSQYRPDFYYPDVGVWHEHWALDGNGYPPKDFTGYAESMQWKKELHRSHGSTLIETTWAEIMDVDGLRRLGETLSSLGIELDWNPDRTGAGVKPFAHEDLARLVRTFMTHVKSNLLTQGDLEERKDRRTPPDLAARSQLFLDVYWAIHEEWEARLRAENLVDFEDMLVQAAAHLESGQAAVEYDLVMVDEFQDASQARARMTRALVQTPGKYLLAVGDDWQSINRFAGADISVMTNFADWFGAGPALRLETTFRCRQTICDVASAFVSKNPRQLSKTVVSARVGNGKPVRVIRLGDPEAVPGAIALEFARIAEAARRFGRKRVSVDVLGRYRFDKSKLPRVAPDGLDVNFRTVHSAKGLEADYIIIPNLTRGRYGFPSNIQDDPVLGLAMVDPDPYPHAEERRLFYVALTRAREEVTLVVIAGQESPFVVELMQAGSVAVEQDEDAADVEVCPRCESGTLVTRTGPYGRFLGCSSFPRCRYTAKAS